jgi:prepilin-type N-terminal cleavage/methylation domain-containing protein
MIRQSARGFTLIELVVAITIIGVCSATVLGTMSLISLRNAEVLASQQAASIAQAYMQEILSKSFAVGTGSGARVNFDDVMDYNTLPDTVVRDQFGNAIAAFSAYRVTVAVAPVLFGAAQSRRIIVTVTDPLNQANSITAYKTAP